MGHIVFATESYEYLAQELCGRAGYKRGGLERKVFPDGERWLRITSDVYGENIVLIGGTHNDAATLDVFDLANGLVAQGADHLSIVIPYFGYSTQERAVLKGEVVTAKSRASLLSAIPRARLSTEVVLLDLHTPGIAHYFNSNLHSVHLSAQPLHLDLIRKIIATGETIIGCTDAGRAKWVQELANEAGVQAAFVYKQRKSDGSTSVTGINADVQGKHLVLYDDMVRTGGSLIKAAAAYRAAGASHVTAVVTHAVLPGDALQKLRSSDHFTELHCTDSHPAAIQLAAQAGGFLKVHSIVNLLGAHLDLRKS